MVTSCLRGNMPSLLRSVMIVAATVFFLNAAFGQSTEKLPSASVRGVVTDSHSRHVVGAKIILRLPTGIDVSTITDADGVFTFAALQAGGYTLNTETPGYITSSLPSFHLADGESKHIDLKLMEKRPTIPSANSATAAPEFYDEPQFTVAGVTDVTNSGGHGSQEISRNRDAVTKATISFKGPATSVPSDAPSNLNEAALRHAVEVNDTYSANYDLAKLLVADNKDSDALPYLERASSVMPKDSPAREKAAVHHLLGDVEEKLGDPLRAEREYQNAAELYPTEPILFDWAADLLLHRAFPPAVEIFSKGSERFPGSIRMRLGLAASWYALGSNDKAFRTLFQVSDLFPEDPDPYMLLGKMQATETTISPEAAGKLARFVKFHPENAFAHYYYACGLWKMRKDPAESKILAQVESHLKIATHLDPQFGAAYLQLGIVHAEQKEFAQAVSYYKQAINCGLQSEDVHYRLATAYTRLGKTSEAQQEFLLYKNARNHEAAEVERERHELRQFVYTLKSPAATTAP